MSGSRNRYLEQSNERKPLEGPSLSINGDLWKEHEFFIITEPENILNFIDSLDGKDEDDEDIENPELKTALYRIEEIKVGDFYDKPRVIRVWIGDLINGKVVYMITGEIYSLGDIKHVIENFKSITKEHTTMLDCGPCVEEELAINTQRRSLQGLSFITLL